MVRPTVAALDIGGTHSRVRVVTDGGQRLEDAVLGEDIERHVSTPEQLEALVRDVCQMVRKDHRLIRAAVAAAGPVRDGRVRMTNWAGTPEIAVREFERWGFPRNQVHLCNDMIAGVSGVHVLREAPGAVQNATVTLYPGTASTEDARSGFVYVAPGTGLGGAGVIAVDLPDGRQTFSAVPVELQHMAMPGLSSAHRELLDQMRLELGGRPPTWEDVGSGRGLVRTRRVLDPKCSHTSSLAPSAADIAQQALDKSDDLSVLALGLYYLSIAGYCQMLALTFGALGGVFLGGSSAGKNREFVRKCGFVEQFLDNHRQRALLERIPVFLITRDVNLDGAERLALQEHPAPTTADQAN